jgi:hypothetical protein
VSSRPQVRALVAKLVQLDAGVLAHERQDQEHPPTARRDGLWSVQGRHPATPTLAVASRTTRSTNAFKDASDSSRSSNEWIATRAGWF